MPARKGVDGWPPRWLTTRRPKRTRGPEVRGFMSRYCRATKDTIATRSGDLLELRPWQQRLIDAVYAETPAGLLVYRTGLIGMPRKNGKTALGAGFGLHGLYLGPDGGEVYSVAGDREQARICFGMARRMVELDFELSAKTKVYRDALEYLDTGSVYRVLSSDAPLKEGLNPSLVLFDEVHVQPDDDLWSVMLQGGGARTEPLVLGITTAGERTKRGAPSLCYRLYEYGVGVARGEVDDAEFFFAWWEPRAGKDADHRDPKTWQESNPAFDDLVAARDFAATLPPKVPEHEFRTKRTNVWVDAVEDSWLADHPGAWSRCESQLTLVATERTAIAVDMSLKWDSTAVVTVGKADDRVVARAKIFHAPTGGRIPFEDVMGYVRAQALEHNASGVAYDPRFFELIAQQLEDAGIRMVEMPQSPERMVAADGHTFDLIVGGVLAHDGDSELTEHVLAAVWRETERGRMLSKGKSKRPIDACRALSMACWELEQAGDGPSVYEERSMTVLG